METRLVATFSSVEIKAGREDDSTLARTLSTALESIKSFSLTADLTGPVLSPVVVISSNLDKVMQDAAGIAVSKQAQRFRGLLEAEISRRTGGRITQIEGSLGSFSEMHNALDTNRQSLRKSLDEATKAQRRQGEDALKNRLKGIF